MNKHITTISLTDISLHVKDSVQQKIILAENGDLEVDIIGVCNQERPKVEEIDEEEELEVRIYFCRCIHVTTYFPVFLYFRIYVYTYLCMYIVYMVICKFIYIFRYIG
jgi:hypothetical protein